MRAIPLVVTALAAALVLTACDDSGDDAKSTTDGTTATAAAGTACDVTRLGVEVGPANAAPAVGDTGNVPVTLTNTGAKACVLNGFPGVRLLAGDTSWTVAREKSAQSGKLTLHQDESATFTVTYVRGEQGGKGNVDTVRISLPGSSGTKDSKWTYGAVAEKGSGLDASVSPFQTAGD
jgi:hypothetical protein